MSTAATLADITRLYDDLGRALGRGLVLAELGSPLGEPLVAAVLDAATAQNPPSAAAIKSALKSLRGAASRFLRAAAERPAAILAVGAALGAYSWLTADESVRVEAVRSLERQGLAALEACEGDAACVATMAAAASRAHARLAGVVGEESSTSWVLLAGVAAAGVILWRMTR